MSDADWVSLGAAADDDEYYARFEELFGAGHPPGRLIRCIAVWQDKPASRSVTTAAHWRSPQATVEQISDESGRAHSIVADVVVERAAAAASRLSGGSGVVRVVRRGPHTLVGRGGAHRG